MAIFVMLEANTLFMLKSFLGSIILVFVVCLSANAQLTNDECSGAIHLGDITELCTNTDQFGNVGATPSPQAQPTCWPNANHDVWFSFVPQAPGIYVQMLGKQVFADNNILQPSLAIYSGGCGNLQQEACQSILSGTNIVELTLVDAVIGQVYYLRVDGRDLNEGNFVLCLESFNPVPTPESDCGSAVTLCDTESFFVDNLSGVGSVTNEVEGSCIQEEFASVWYNWTCDKSGSLTFTISPNNEVDDLDFALYRLPNGIDDCAGKELIRCMASGETVGAGEAANAPCAGPTGLSLGSNDTEEFPGCAAGDDNFVSAVNMVAGESYALVINNFSQSGSGFQIEFGGTGTFLGPVPDFEVIALQEFECDKTIRYTNESFSDTDNIVNWTWNFGAGSAPLSASGVGPHEVIYESFGDKLAALTIESSRGCLVTKIIELYVEPCCQDTSTLNVDAVTEDLICNGIPEGLISASGMNGNPDYQYSLDGNSFQPSAVFPGLFAGSYNVYIQDIKGCVDSVEVFIDEPPPLIVDAGEDMETIIGCMVDLDASYQPNIPVDITWTPNDGFSCDDCLDPTVLPAYIGSQDYTIQVTDNDGCTASDQLAIFVEDERPVYAPNVFSPNRDGTNEVFTIFAGKAAVEILELYVYDRWGNRIYYGQNLPLNDANSGWDGRFKNQPVNPGMYAWYAVIRYIDTDIEYSGDITVVR